jgi:hypothetical protein
MTNNDILIKKFFIKFLKNKKVFSSFIKYARLYDFDYKHYGIYIRFDNYMDFLIKQGTYRELINYLLIWNNTSEGFDFWNNIDVEWRKISDKYISVEQKTGQYFVGNDFELI